MPKRGNFTTGVPYEFLLSMLGGFVLIMDTQYDNIRNIKTN